MIGPPRKKILEIHQSYRESGPYMASGLWFIASEIGAL
jgi:hypothetical protein